MPHKRTTVKAGDLLVRRGDQFPLLTRDGRSRFYINGDEVLVEKTPEGFVILNNLPEIKMIRVRK